MRCLERVLRSTALLVGHIPKFDHVSDYMHDVVHWLHLSPANCLIQGLGSGLGLPPGPGGDQAPAYLRERCRSTQDVQARRSLRSSAQGELLVPYAQTSIRQRRTFSVASPVIWTGLAPYLCMPPRVPTETLVKNYVQQYYCSLVDRIPHVSYKRGRRAVRIA